jgi:hypothetical protein
MQYLVSQPSAVASNSMNILCMLGTDCLPKTGYYLYLPPPDRLSLGRFTLPLPLPAHPTVTHTPLFLFSFHFTAQRPPHHDISIMVTKQQVTSDAVEDGPPISVPDSGDTGESGKLKMIVQLVRKCMGIKDIASM